MKSVGIGDNEGGIRLNVKMVVMVVVVIVR